MALASVAGSLIKPAPQLHTGRGLAAAIRQWQEIIDHTKQKVIDHVEALKVPTNLRRKLIKELDKNPSQPWDETLKSFLSPKQIKG